MVFGYKGVLLLFGMLLVYETRSIKFSQINDSRLVSTSMCNIVVRFAFLLQSFLPAVALAPVLHTCGLLLQKSRRQCVCIRGIRHCVSALEVFLNDMRYINPRFTLLYFTLLVCVSDCWPVTAVTCINAL